MIKNYLSATVISKINDFMTDKGVYYTIFERVLMQQEKQVKI